MALTNGIIHGFAPKFKSVSKDCDRYFDALYTLSEEGVIKVDEMVDYASSGNLWIYTQYIENGYIDDIEADLKKDVTDRDFYGALFENTRLVLDQLISRGEQDRVVRIYKAAIAHRMKAFKSEHGIYTNPKKKPEAQAASKKWLQHYLPSFKEIIAAYAALLSSVNQMDSDLETYRNFADTINRSLRG